jgi:hypothetical protein
MAVHTLAAVKHAPGAWQMHRALGCTMRSHPPPLTSPQGSLTVQGTPLTSISRTTVHVPNTDNKVTSSETHSNLRDEPQQHHLPHALLLSSKHCQCALQAACLLRQPE